ncbi:MAG: universal stress protein [Hyphomonas sp.]
MLHNILVATEFSTKCEPALVAAAELAALMKADLTVVHVSQDGVAGREMLESAAQTYKARPCLGQGEPARFILEAARAEKADLVVLGAPVRRSVGDLLLGTTAQRVIRQSPAPVLMTVGTTPKPYRKVMVATDFSEASEQAVKALKETGLAGEALIQLVNIYETPEISLMMRGGSTSAQINNYVVEQGHLAAMKLAEFDAKTGAGAATRIPRLGDSATGRMLCALATETGADLIVVGTQGHSGINGFVLGSVAQDVLRLSDVDVLAVPVSA